MQTFLPCQSFLHSASCLDNKRLGKQRVEAKQILLALTNPNYGWQHHPAVLMWKGYESALAIYGIIICSEWLDRGFKDTCKKFFINYRKSLSKEELENPKFPKWLGGEIHKTHQSNLLRKDFEHYSKFGWGVPNDLEYHWPVRIVNKRKAAKPE